MSSIRVGPVFLYTERLEELAAFYRDILELPVKSYEPSHSMWLDMGPVQIMLHAPEADWCPAPYEPNSGGVVIWLAVEDDLDDIYRHLLATGVTILRPPSKDERPTMLIADPEGRRIGLHHERERRTS